MGNLSGSSKRQSSQQRGIFPDVTTSPGQNIPADDPVVLKVSRPIGETVLQTCDGLWARFHMHSVSADFEVVFQPVLLPCHAPVRRNSTYVETKSLSVRRLDTRDVSRTI